MMDIDNYKHITNTYGAGTRAAFMREFGGVISRTLRPFDSACRYGADEVIVMLPNSTAREITESAHAICKAIQAHTFTEHDVTTSVSCGLAVFPDDGESVEDIILSAKHSVFEAQRAGRNKVFRRDAEVG